MQQRITFHCSCEISTDVAGGCSDVNIMSAHLRCSNIILFAQKHKTVKQEQHSRAQEPHPVTHFLWKCQVVALLKEDPDDSIKENFF